MVMTNIPDDQVFADAAQSWNLPSLYADLAVANTKQLTPVQKKFLRGLLLGYSPDDIAQKVYSTPNNVRVTLSRFVYGAIKNLCDIDSSQELNWGQVTSLLAKYRKTLKTLEQCWQELKDKVNTTTGLKVEIPALSNMGARPNRQRKEIPFKSNLIYRVDSPKTGHLILFEREPNGTIVCLCPSEFAPDSYHAGKETVLPHPESEYEYFGSDELGWEQLVAVITPDLPPFQWLEDSRKEALEVNQEHLAGLLDYVNGQPNAEVLYTEYLVVNA